MKPTLIIILLFAAHILHAKEIMTNAVIMDNAPEWLKATRIEKVTDRIQNKLEWSIHRVKVRWYFTQAEFEKAHSLGGFVIAVTKNENVVGTVHLGPKVTESNFDEVFGHELVHVIVIQKYKNSIPKWFEEGLANHMSHSEKVDYKWLAKQAFPEDVRQLAHPVRGSSSEITYRYKASQALAEMLEKKCELENLIRISLERNMEDYIKTYCEIKDLNLTFRDWVKKKAA